MNTFFKTGPFLIDPDQKKGSSTKFNVFCDFGDNGKLKIKYRQNP